MDKYNLSLLLELLIGFLCGLAWGWIIWGNKKEVDENG